MTDIKRSARAKAQYAVRTGRLERRPCEVCGTPSADAHHDDYSSPLDVRWLCRTHHAATHLDLIRSTRASGERSGAAKLTDEQVRDIRRRHRPGTHPARKTGGSSTELAREFGVTRQYIGQIVSGKWRVG